MTLKLPNWHVLLHDAVHARRFAKFEWGKFDCTMLACDLMEAEIGIDPGAWFRGKYDNRVKALAALRRFLRLKKGEMPQPDLLPLVAEKIAKQLDAPEVGINYAQRGDCLLIATPEIEAFPTALSVCMGERAPLPKVGGGIEMVPFDRAVRAWRL